MKKIIVIMLIIMSPANAGIYKWTDNKGNVHFGDRPVDPKSATELKVIINRNTGVTNSSGNKKEREYLLKKIERNKEERSEKKSEKLAKSKKRKKKCDAYRRSYQNHIQSNRSYHMSTKGERTYLSDKERDLRKKKLSKGVSKYCH